MTLASILSILLINLAGMITPGPDVLLVMRTAVRSRRHGVATAVGIAVGNLIWVSITVIGVAALFSTHPAVILVIKLVGGGWLAWLGYQMLSTGLRSTGQRTPAGVPPGGELLGSPLQAWRAGLLTNLSNPKYVLFLMALFAPFLPPDISPWAAVALIVSMPASALVFFSALALIVSTPAIQRRLLSWGALIDIVSGLIFAGVGIVFIVTSLSAVVATPSVLSTP